MPGDKRRPVLVLTSERFISRLNAVLVAPVTTNVRGIPTEVPLGPADGMPSPCAANFDSTFTLARRRFLDHITTLPPARLLAYRSPPLTCGLEGRVELWGIEP